MQIYAARLPAVEAGKWEGKGRRWGKGSVINKEGRWGEGQLTCPEMVVAGILSGARQDQPVSGCGASALA